MDQRKGTITIEKIKMENLNNIKETVLKIIQNIGSIDEKSLSKVTVDKSPDSHELYVGVFYKIIINQEEDALQINFSTDNSLTITAVASQTEFTVSEAVTIADNVILLLMADGGEEMIVDAIGFKVAGPQFDSRSDITTITRVGADDSVALQLEEATTSSFIDELSNDGGRLVQETGNAASITDGINLEGQDSVQTDPYVVETSLNDAATFSRTGSSSGTASVLKGITVAAS